MLCCENDGMFASQLQCSCGAFASPLLVGRGQCMSPSGALACLCLSSVNRGVASGRCKHEKSGASAGVFACGQQALRVSGNNSSGSDGSSGGSVDFKHCSCSSENDAMPCTGIT